MDCRKLHCSPIPSSACSGVFTGPPSRSLLRGVLSNGLLNPDYNRDIQTVLTPVYQASDAYAGVLLTALTMIDAGLWRAHHQHASA